MQHHQLEQTHMQTPVTSEAENVIHAGKPASKHERMSSWSSHTDGQHLTQQLICLHVVFVCRRIEMYLCLFGGPAEAKAWSEAAPQSLRE